MDASRGRGTDGRRAGTLAAAGRRQGAAAGRLAELEARRHLEAQGLGFVAANYRCRYGELDLVMRDGACLVFVEVRSRGSIRSGAPEASLTARKLRRLRLAAQCFMRDHRHFGGMMLRFDVVGILTRGPQARIRWVRNAVQFDGR